MTKHDSEASDMAMMRRCVALAQSAGSRGEYPFASVIGRRGEFICESLNMVRNEGDVTRHAEMVAISSAQKKLRRTRLAWYPALASSRQAAVVPPRRVKPNIGGQKNAHDIVCGRWYRAPEKVFLCLSTKAPHG